MPTPCNTLPIAICSDFKLLRLIYALSLLPLPRRPWEQTAVMAITPARPIQHLEMIITRLSDLGKILSARFRLSEAALWRSRGGATAVRTTMSVPLQLGHLDVLRP